MREEPTTTGIDWDEVHRRMALVQSAIEQGLEPSAHEKKQVLKKGPEPWHRSLL